MYELPKATAKIWPLCGHLKAQNPWGTAPLHPCGSAILFFKDWMRPSRVLWYLRYSSGAERLCIANMAAILSLYDCDVIV